VISLEGLTLGYGDRVLLDDVSIRMVANPTVLMGPSGSGKSTLLRAIAGLQQPAAGRVLIGGQPVRRATWRSAGDARVALIHQDYRLLPFLSVAENLLLAAETRGVALPSGALPVALARVGMGAEFLARRPDTLSGGEQQRIAIARALVCNVEVLLADEPTGALDARTTNLVADALVEIAATTSVSVLIATHDPVVAARVEQHLVVADGDLRVRHRAAS